jgi:arginase
METVYPRRDKPERWRGITRSPPKRACHESDMTRYEIIEAPSVLGLFPKGVEHLPQVLLDAGVAERLGAARGARVRSPACAGGIDQESGIRNATALAEYARLLADQVGSVLSRGALPIVLGGDCSILLGSLLALRRRGRYGLLFLDGHADFAHPSEDPAGEAASMDLALATGRGPKVVADIEGRGPLVRDDDVSLLGYRVITDGTDRHLGTHVRDTAILVRDLDDIRRDGLTASLEASLARVGRDELSGFFVHLDADVLDDAVMPAVDYRAPGGLRFSEVARIVSAALATGKAVGLEVTIFNPALDPDGSLARGLVDVLVAGLNAAGSG